MKLSSFTAYVKQLWKNKPDTSTPLSAERLTHMEEGIKGNSDAIEAIAAAVVSQIVNDPDKIASMAALYSVNQKIGDVSKLPDSAADVVTAIAKQNSNLESANTVALTDPEKFLRQISNMADDYGVAIKILDKDGHGRIIYSSNLASRDFYLRNVGLTKTSNATYVEFIAEDNKKYRLQVDSVV